MTLRTALRSGVPAVLLAVALGSRRRSRRAQAGLLLVLTWLVVYARYRRDGIKQTRREFDSLKRVDRRVVARHYNERVATVEEFVPGVRRMGCHLAMDARLVGAPVAPAPRPGVWPRPFNGRGEAA